MHLLRRLFDFSAIDYKLIKITKTYQHKKLLIFLFVKCELFDSGRILH